jgi:valyl-tRNA synthetase
VKITPAHDFNDFKVGKRAGLAEMLNILGRRRWRMATADACPGEVSRASIASRRARRWSSPTSKRSAARCIEDREDHASPFGDRSERRHRAVADGPVVRRRPTLAKPAIEAVEDGQDHEFVPKKLGEDLLRVDAQHRAVVRLAPALVGAPDSGLV